MLLRMLLALTGVFYFLPAVAQERVALVVGASEYGRNRQERLARGFIVPDRLDNAVRDAQLIEQSLVRVGFDVMFIKDPNKRQLHRAVALLRNKVSKLTENGIAVFCFAGHGTQGKPPGERDINNYLLPIDANIATEVDLDVEAYGLGQVTHALSKSNKGSLIVILDACRNFAFPEAVRSTQKTRGLAEAWAQPGTLIAYSTRPGDVAFDGPKGGNGPFAKALSESLSAPGRKRLEDVFINTRNLVLRATNRRQQPWENGSLRRVVYLERSSATPPGNNAAERAWKHLQFSTDPKVILRFARKHRGTNAAMAAEQRAAMLSDAVMQKRLQPSNGSCRALPSRIAAKIRVRPGLVLCDPKQLSSRIKITSVLAEVVRYENGHFGVTNCYSDDRECGVHWGGPRFRIEAGKEKGVAYFVPVY